MREIQTRAPNSRRDATGPHEVPVVWPEWLVTCFHALNPGSSEWHTYFFVSPFRARDEYLPQPPFHFLENHRQSWTHPALLTSNSARRPFSSATSTILITSSCSAPVQTCSSVSNAVNGSLSFSPLHVVSLKSHIPRFQGLFSS